MRPKYLPAKPHGGHGTDTYMSWKCMMQRCYTPSCASFPRYGAVGATVCERWKVYKNFLADMGARPEGRSIDRLNNDRPYEPGNCRWATLLEQANNKRNTLFLIVAGEKISIADFARKTNQNYETLRTRRALGWSDEQITASASR